MKLLKNICSPRVTLAAIMAVSVTCSYGQGLGIGFRVTPSRVGGVAVENPSPSNVWGWGINDVNYGVYALKYFKSSRWGARLSVDFGRVNNLVGIDAPENAFGKRDGDEQVNVWFRTNAFRHTAISLMATYKIPINGRYFELKAGPSLRKYNLFPKDEFSEIFLAFNRATPFDQHTEVPDVRARITDLDEVHISLPVSIDYVIRMSKRYQVKFGLMYNISKPLDGDLAVQMYGDMYYGKFRPRTSFYGINAEFEWLTRRASSNYQKRLPSVSTAQGKFRKSFYAESFTTDGFLTANFDMRVKHDRNHGFGFSAGAGLGNGYLGEVPSNNRSPWERSLAIPLAINYIVGKNKHGVELAIGVTPQIALQQDRDGIPDYGALYNGRLGYRFQPIREGFIGRVSWAPFREYNSYQERHDLTLKNFAVSVGYSFK